MNVIVRELREDDLELVMHWRMDPDITKYMNTDPKLTLDLQRKWFDTIKKSDEAQYWMIEVDNQPVGIINIVDIDWEKGSCSWGYYIGEKKHRSFALAISLEMSLYDYVFDVLKLKELHNEIFSVNESVIKLHLMCGSHIIEEVIGEVEKAGVMFDITHMSIAQKHWENIRQKKTYEKIDFDIKFSLHHIGYAVANIEESILMHRVLGYCRDTKIIDDTSRDVRIAFIKNKMNDSLIELISPMNDKSPITATLKERKNVASPYHVCYEVDNINRAISWLKRKKFILISSVTPAVAFNNRNVAFLINKEAGLIELLEK